MRVANIKKNLFHFFYAPTGAEPLGALRIGIGAVLLVQAFWIWPDLQVLYGRNGILQGELVDWMASLALPNAAWVQQALHDWGISFAMSLKGLFGIYVLSLLSFTVGWKSQLSCAVAWFTHFILLVSGFTLTYGVDHFANIFLFLMIWMPIGGAYSLDRGKKRALVSSSVRFSLRLCQLELCIVYFTSGLHKASGIQWWNGEAIWRSVMLPMESHLDSTWLASVPWLAMILCWGTLLLEIGYPVLMYHSPTRRLALLSVMGLHIGIALFLGLVSFGAMMIVLSVCVFGFARHRSPMALQA